MRNHLLLSVEHLLHILVNFNKEKKRLERRIYAERREQGSQNHRGCRGEGSVKSPQNVSSQASTCSHSEVCSVLNEELKPATCLQLQQCLILFSFDQESLPNVTPTQSEECFVGMPKEELSSNNHFNPEVELLQHNSQQEQKARPTASQSLTSDGCIHNPAAVCLRIQDVEMLPGSDFNNESDALFIESHQGESDNRRSHCVTVLRIDSADISHCESPVVKVRHLETSTPKVSITVGEVTTPGEITERCPSDGEHVGLAMPISTKKNKPLTDSHFSGIMQVNDGHLSESHSSIDLLGTTSLTHVGNFDPEEGLDSSLACIGGRSILIDNSSNDAAPGLVPVSSAYVRSETPSVSEGVLEALKKNLETRLLCGWKLHIDNERIYAIALVPNKDKFLVRRAVHVACDGSNWKVQVHLETLPEGHPIYTEQTLKPFVPLTLDSVGDFTTTVIRATAAVQLQSVCIGVDLPSCVEKWTNHPDCTLDTNQFEEPGYEKTLRHKTCSYLISGRAKRCGACNRYIHMVRSREERRDPGGEVNPSTRHDYLTPTRLRQLAKHKQEKIRLQGAQLATLKRRIDKMVEEEGVPVDRSLEEDLNLTLEDAPQAVQIFWESQKNARTVKKASAMRWHPLMIRWALQIKSLSSSAYAAMRNSGFIKLPSQRTLYEYSHANPTKEGIQHHVLKRLADEVQKSTADFYKYVVVSFDEMYVYQNIVYNKGTGEIRGYTNLSSVEDEIRRLENEAENEPERPPPIAKTMLTYMARETANRVKGIVACFPTSVLTKEILHARTCDVIEQLEVAGIKVIVLVGDGHPVNSAFFNMHPPLTLTTSGVVFDTRNIFSKSRPIFFFNDAPHLLKTIRNCLANSGAHKNTRMLMLNGELLSWKTIIACMKSEENATLKHCHKLNPQNVFLNSYSIMRVSLAAQVLSRTVAMYIQNILKVKNTTQLVRFLLLVNRWWDCVNGLYFNQHVRTQNPDLAPYVKEDDPRFSFILTFLDYLDQWKAQVGASKITDDEKKRRLLSQQTLEGIERTSRLFIACFQYLLKLRRNRPGTQGEKEGYLLGRTFQQDELEHYFSGQRARGGGSSHPNPERFLENQNLMEVQRSLGLDTRGGNTEAAQEAIDVNIPVFSRSKTRRKLSTANDDER